MHSSIGCATFDDKTDSDERIYRRDHEVFFPPAVQKPDLISTPRRRMTEFSLIIGENVVVNDHGIGCLK